MNKKEERGPTLIATLPEWIYPRPSGDLVVFAPTAEDALAVMREQGGYTDLDPSKLRKTERVLSDELAPIDGSEGAQSARSAVESERRALGLASTLPAPAETYISSPSPPAACPAAGNLHPLGSKPLKCEWCRIARERDRTG